jgi:acetoin:2,6-dichlorophenolindophenol oxidoreductase subunit alpha
MTDPGRLRAMLRRMLLIRAFEERVAELYAAGALYGHVHLYVGEEAVAVGTCMTLRDDDYVTSTHRGHGHCLAKGAEPPRMMAELFGRRTGYCKGKGGSMHIADFSRGILGANGVVGGGAPAAVGAALGVKLQARDSVVVCFFGDGAMNQGVLHEAMNLAAIWTLPVLFVCENNRYAITTPCAYATSGPGVVARAAAYGIPGTAVDGMDVLAVEAAVVAAVARARGGGGPSVLAMETYRFRGHTEGEEALGWQYRPPEEIAAWKAKDPITRLEQRLLEQGIVTPEALAGARRDVQEEIDAAVTFAKESPDPDPSEVWSDVSA